MAPAVRKRVDVDPTVMKRAPDGSAFLTCESCKASVPVALADMHSCENDAAFKANLARMREEYMQNHQAEKESKSKQTKEKKSEKKAGSESKSTKRAAKDPNAPKKPLSGYMLFMEDFRKTYKEEHPESKGVAEVAKAGGVKWNSMSDEEKQPYNDEQAKRKEEYAAKMAEYKGEQVGEQSEVVDKEEISSDEMTNKKRRRLTKKGEEEPAEEATDNELEDEL